LSNKASLLPHNLTILPLFVFKDSFGEGHLEEGKPQKPTKGQKSGEAK
jgi:hypothetical protein